jgi:5-methylcytosine-specific restriction endonuclease McrA
LPHRVCLEPRCPNFATARGRCDDHRRALERDRSRRRREATRDAQGRGVFKTKVWLMRRRQVLAEQPICALCDHRLSEEVDHIVPLSRGGAPYARTNLRGLCRQCHWERHAA